MIGINESLEYQCKLAELRQSIYEKIKPCNHECKDSVVREVAYRQEYNKDEHSCDSIITYEELGFCEKCCEFYRKYFEEVVERKKICG